MHTKPKYPFAVLYFTGSMKFNVKMRQTFERCTILNEHFQKGLNNKPVYHKFVSEKISLVI